MEFGLGGNSSISSDNSYLRKLGEVREKNIREFLDEISGKKRLSA